MGPTGCLSHPACCPTCVACSSSRLQQTVPDASGEAPAACPQPGDAPLSHGWQREYLQYPYLYNIANQSARAFYQRRGLSPLALPTSLSPTSRPLIMQCRHCLRYALGYCVRRGGRKPQWREPFICVWAMADALS